MHRNSVAHKYPQSNNKLTTSDLPSTLLVERFTELLEKHVTRLTMRNGKATGCCPSHQDTHPSFSADVNRCVWYCFGCSTGGGVRDFARLVGEALPPQRRKSLASVHSLALARTKRKYDEWQHRTYLSIMRQYEDLQTEKEIAEITYRFVMRHPDQFSETTLSKVTHRLASIYDRESVLELHLYLLTERFEQHNVVSWWLAEEQEVSSNV